MKHLLDEELVKKCLSGEEAAFEVLVKRYEKQIFSLAYRLCGDYDEAGDLAQEAFLHIYRVLNKFSDDRKFFPWMYRVAHNVCVNTLTKRPKETVPIEDFASFDFGEEGRMDSPEETFLQAETGSIIREAISELPENYRLPVMYRFLEDLSYQEIADKLEVPVSTIETRLFRGRQMLQKKLKILLERGQKN
ncbi:MAG: sigma-70 family RNA polymerase sigma factor [Peptococcaceae bacterium]|nr:sigma-70 family RNA polymerase sigma factor [Peptococcaceae bacterium]